MMPLRFGIVIAAVLAAFSSRAESGVETNGAAGVAVPAPAEILRTLNPAHPRLLKSAAGFAELKTRIDSDALLKKWYANVRRDADRMLGQPPSKYEIPDGKRLLATSRRVVDRTLTLGLAYRMDGDRRHADRLWRELEAAGNFKDWNPSHFLDTAEMTAAFGLGYDWLYDVWTESQRAFLRSAMVEKGLKPALDAYENPKRRSFWTTCSHNWNQVCNGGIGLGALALGDVEPELSGRFLNRALSSIQGSMREFAPDGAWNEGPGYWGYATMYNVLFLAALDTALGTDHGLTGIRAFGECGLFPIYATGPSHRSFNYADSGDGAPRPSQLLWLGDRFNRPVYVEYQRRVATGEPLDLVYYPRREMSLDPDTLPLDRFFRGSEVAMLRGSWTDPNATWVGFKAGDNKANHSHLDLGSFVLDALGRRWAVDLGGDDYNLPGYFGGQRWTYFRLRAESHNTLVINPGQGPDQDPRAVALIVRRGSSDARAFAVANLTPAYAAHAKNVRRGVALLERTNVLVQDEWTLPKPGDVRWAMHTEAGVKVSEAGNEATLTLEGRQLRARILLPKAARFDVGAAAPMSSSPNPPDQRNNKRIRQLSVRLAGTEQGTLAVVFEPLTGGKTAPVAAPITPLEDW